MADKFWAQPPIAIAHRGGAAAFGADKYKVENTLEAFSKAIELGYRYLELDVITTSDNKVILLHVASYRAEGKLGLKDAPDPKKLQKMSHNELKGYLNRDIPLLDELLEKFPKAKFFADAKTDEAVKPLAGMIKRNNAYDRVVVGSFFPRRLAAARRILGSRGRLNINISKIPIKLHKDEVFLKSNPYIGSVHLPYIWATKHRVSSLQARGIKVLVWTPNTRRRINKTLKLGADGIISDNILLLKEVLESRDQ